MKKSIALVIAVLMLAALCACSVKKAERGPAADNTPAESLWGKELSIDTDNIPSRAFESGNELCTGISSDGKLLLMDGGTDVPYLWDIEEKERIELYFGDENLELLSGRYASLYGEELEGEELFEAFMGEKSRLRVKFGAQNTWDNYMLVNMHAQDAGIAAEFVLDTDTGALYTVDNGGNIGGVYDERILTYQLGSDEVTLTKLESDHGKSVDFGRECELDECSVTYATFLSDGSICANVRDLALDIENGQENVIMVQNTEGDFESYPLGKIMFNAQPNVIVSVGSEWIIAYSQQYARQFAPYIINRSTGEVGCLVKDGNDIDLVDIDEADEMSGMIFLSSMADGKTAIFYDMEEARLALFNPEEMDFCWLDEDEEVQFPMPLGFTGNGYDKFMYWTNTEYSCIINIEAE